jgi:type 1 glutamine amidotransferase
MTTDGVRGMNKRKRALVVWGGWEGHQPRVFAELWTVVLGESGFEVELSDTLDVFCDRETMSALDLVIPIWTMGELNVAQEKGLLDAVRDGTGIAGWHGGMGDAFRASASYQWMVGGQFVAHPDGIREYRVTIVDHEDAITAGIGDFSVRSEQYYMHVDPGNHVLATTTFETESAPWVNGTVMPVIWKRRFGRGRVFYSSIGHTLADHEISAIRELQRRGLLWASA